MDALQEMEIIWPAAARALELLRGAQASLADVATDSDVSNSTNLSNTRKRPATHTLDDSSFAQPPPPVDDSFLPLRSFPPQVYAQNGQYGAESRGLYYPPAPVPYDRWQGQDGVLAGDLTFNGALSTAVMGPTYSTGLVNERQHRGEARFAPPPQQYWSDYGAAPFPQLGVGPGYGSLHDPSAAMGVPHPTEPQMYQPLHDQYNLYPQ